MERLNKSEKIFKIVAYFLVIVFAIIALYPIVYVFSASISGKYAYENGDVILLPKDLNFQVYGLLLNKKGFWTSYVNTLFYTVFGTAWSMLVSCCGAYALSKKRLLFKRQLNFFVVFTMWFSAGMIPLFLNYTQLGVDNRVGIVFAFGVQAYNIILLRNYFEGVPKDIEDAARIDGANEFQIFRRIYIPMSTAALATVTLFYATSRWNGYFWSMVLLEPSEQPIQVFLRNEIEQYHRMLDDMDPGLLSFSPDSYAYAMIVASIIPVLLIYPYISKYFAKGVNLGGVKE